MDRNVFFFFQKIFDRHLRNNNIFKKDVMNHSSRLSGTFYIYLVRVVRVSLVVTVHKNHNSGLSYLPM